ncbi:MAG: osmoprotectant transporter permease [Chthoniobacteraceae bacterium]
MLFRILWWFDALIALVFATFFVIGIGDGSVSSFNIGLWLGILAALAGVLLGSKALRAKKHSVGAICVLLVLGIPGALGVLFFLVVLIAQPRWN